MVKFKFDLMPSTFWRFLINFMKIGYQRKDYKVVTWNCFTQRYNGNSRLHNYNRNSHVHNALLKIPPPWLQQTSTCIISMKIVTHIFVAKTFTCINVAEISNYVIATETVTCIIATEPQNLHNCNRCWHQCNCYRKCQLHSSNRNCHQQNWLQKLSLVEMVPVRDPFGYNKEIYRMSENQV